MFGASSVSAPVSAAPRLSALALAVAFVLQVSLAETAEPQAHRSASLGWTRLPGSERCVGTRELAELVEKRLGYSAFASAAKADVSIEGTIGPAARKGHRAMLAVADRNGRVRGTRQIETADADCRDIDETLALAIALLIDPDARLDGTVSPAPPPPVPASPPPPPQVIVERVPVYVPVPVAAPEKESATQHWEAELDAGGLALFGALPEVAFAMAAGAGLDSPQFPPVRAEVTLAPMQRLEITEGASVSFFTAKLGLLMCPLERSTARWFFEACAGLEPGLIAASGTGFDSDAAGIRGQLALLAQLRASVKLVGPLGLGMAGGGAVPLLRHEFAYSGRGERVRVFEVPWATASLGAYAEWRLR